MFFDSGQNVTLEQLVGSECGSTLGNNGIITAEGRAVFRTVDEYFEVHMLPPAFFNIRF